MRTIERDLDALRQSGVPIFTEPGRSGGYAIDRSRTLPPLALTAAEALAISVALRESAGSPDGVAIAPDSGAMTTPKMDDLAQAWCEMWNEDPTLARRLVTEDFRVWFGSTANGDDLRGPGGLERFVARARAERGVRFTPRVVVADDGGERFAYSWDARFPDGTVHTGVDAYTLRDGEAAELERAAEGWSPMWNGATGLTAELLADGFRIWFAATRSAADDLTGPNGLADYVTRFRAARPELTFGKHRELIVDSARQRVAFAWTGAISPTRSVGGIDLFQYGAGRIARAWSWTGGRPFTF